MREHFNHSINRANQFYIADMQIIKAESRGKPQDRSYKHRIFTNPVKILRFLNRTIWRDSCLNVIYKLMSSVIANSLKSVLDKIISGRYIGENIRTIYDILFETKQQNIPGLMLSINFQQAFDTVSWKFIEKTLDYFNFGPSI